MNFSRSRRALAQPRFLLAMTAMASAVGGISYLATAQTGRAPVKMTPKSGSTKSKPATLADLPALVRQAGASGKLAPARAATLSSSKGGRSAQAVVNGNNVSGFNLDDIDLTPNSPSDEREPLFSPSGDLITFRSNGADSNGDGLIDSVNANGKYHVWVMNSDGSAQTQLTGLGTDAGRNQLRPSWSPDGNQLVYVDGDGAAAQLFVVGAFSGSTPEQRTFFAGEKRSPAWAPNGLTITFSTKTDPTTGTALNSFDLFSIDPGGDAGTTQRLTGGSADAVGDTVDDLSPAFSVVDGSTLYFSSDRDINANGQMVKITGRRIWRLASGVLSVVTNPASRTGFKASDVISDDFPTLSLAKDFSVFGSASTNNTNRTVTEQLAFQTNSRLNDSDTNLDLNIWDLPISSTSDGNGGSVSEPAGAAFILTNSLSSASTAQSGVANGGEDFAPDREPSFSRSVVSPQSVGALAFASQRRVNPNPAATTSNPTGGNGVASTNDIFSTGTVDTTPPILVPQSIGNQMFPVVSPTATLSGQGQGNPRTFEAGLRPGAEPGTSGSLKLAVVIDERESGLSQNSSVVAVIRDADQVVVNTGQVIDFGPPIGVQTLADPDASPVDNSISVTVARERSHVQTNTFVLTAVDDGINEKQAGAVAGDGIFYCSADVKSPVSGEYYMDIVATDQKLNTLTYDNIWGFSTRPFVKTKQDLLVSDYTTGQLFPNLLSGNGSVLASDGDDGRFAKMFPVESYLINANGPTGALGVGTTADTPPKSQQSTANAFPLADVYRILCRGPVTASLLNAYKPSIVSQIDPNETTPANGKPFTAKTRKVTVAQSSVTWASPYTGTVFAGPGTLVDAATQGILTDFSNAGGRLMVMGRDIGFGLTSNGTVSSDFMNTVLGANWGGDVPTSNGGVNVPGVVIQAQPGGFIKDSLSYFPFTTQDLQNLQIPFHFENKTKLTDNWDDAASNLDPNTAVGATSSGVTFVQQATGVQPDELLPTNAAGATTVPAYTVAGRVVGQRVTRTIGSTEARAVVLGFGLESVNRRYRTPTDTFPTIALDARAKVVLGVNSFLKTGSLSGTVINAATNQPIPNFLVRVTSGTTPPVVFLARTDANGNYSVQGLNETLDGPGYTVEPAALDSSGKLLPSGTKLGVNGAQSSPPGFFSGSIVRFIEIAGGSNAPGVNLRPIPIVPGSIRGKVVTADPNDPTKQVPANGLFVLVRSKNESSLFPGGGQYADVVKTDAAGNFTFSGVPALIDLEVVLNPAIEDIPAKSGLRVRFTAPAFTGQFQNPNLASRLITGLNRPTASTTPALQVPSNGTFVLNDSTPDDKADSGTPLVLGRFLATLNGKVTINGKVAPNVTVQLFTSTGAAVSPARTAVTDANGAYTIDSVPAGSYVVKATTRLGSSATSSTFTVVNNTSVVTVTVKTINISAPILSGKVNLKTIGVNTKLTALPNSTVELLNGSGKSFSPVITTTADAMGKYSFAVALNSSYRLRATADIDGTTSTSQTTDVIKATANTTVPDLNITRYQITGQVQSAAGAGAAKAIVELTVGDNTLRSTTANGSGNYSFSNILPGTYVLRAFASAQAGAASGSAPVKSIVTVGGAPVDGITTATIIVPPVTIKLTGTTTNPLPTPTPTPGGNGTGTDGTGSVSHTFAASSTFTMSLPYAIDNVLGTLTVDQAFTTPLATGGYRLFYFNAVGQKNKPIFGGDLVEITSGSFKLTRGQGYVLVTGANPVTSQTPTQNAALKSYAGTSFSIPLTWNTTFLSDTSEPNNRNNGYNLIGFPFNPAKYNSVSFPDAQVKYGATTYESIDAAAAAGIIDRQLYTMSGNGLRTPVAFDDRNIHPFVGYFVHILRKDQDVTLVLRNPT